MAAAAAAAATTKRVRVCPRSYPCPAVDCPVVTLDLAAIIGWGKPLLAALAAGATAHAAAAVSSVWLREYDDDDEQERLDTTPKKGWKKLLGLDSDKAVLLLDIERTGTPLRGLGDADEVEYSSEDQQNYERLARLFLKDPQPIVCALQDVSTPVHLMPFWDSMLGGGGGVGRFNVYGLSG